MPDEFTIAELEDPLNVLPKNLLSLLSSFKLDDEFENTSFSTGCEVGGTGHQTKAYFALDDPFESLPLQLKASLKNPSENTPFARLEANIDRIELPWDVVRAEAV